jgi:uncharacterized membrane-anchored protein
MKELNIAEFEDAHKHIVASLHQCKTNDSAVIIIVLGRILAELASRAAMPKDLFMAGLSDTYDMALAEEKEEAGEPH